jgi:hypothetical protein
VEISVAFTWQVSEVAACSRDAATAALMESRGDVGEAIALLVAPGGHRGGRAMSPDGEI